MRKILINKTVQVLFYCIIIQCILLFVVVNLTSTKIAYVNIEDVVDSFHYKKDFEKQFAKEKETIVLHLDSLEMEIKQLYFRIEKETNKKAKDQLLSNYEVKSSRYSLIKENAENKLTQLANSMNEQMYERLHEYIKEYAELNNYDFIHGVESENDVLFSNNKYDISNEVILYINTKYEELCFSSCTNISTENEKRVIYKYESVPPSKVEEYDLSESLNYLDWFRKYSSYLAEERIIDSMVYGVLMQPVDFLVLKELDTSSVEMFNKLKKEYDGMEYYLFSFGNTQKTDVLKAKNVMQYDKIDIMQHIDFDIQNNFFIEDIYGRRKCKFYHLERTAGLKPYYTAIIAFEKVTISNTNKVINTDPELIDKTIIYEDMLFGSGIVKIMISKDKFELLPHILKKEI